MSELLIFSLAALLIIAVLVYLAMLKKVPFEAALSLRQGLQIFLNQPRTNARDKGKDSM